MKRKPETDQDLIDALADLLESAEEDESLELVDEELRAAGLDPEAVGQRMAEVAQGAYRASPANWRQRAQAERAAAERQLRQRATRQEQQDRDEIVERINSIVARSPGPQDAPQIQAHFRNFEHATDEDLANLLADLEFLERSASEDD